MKDKPLFYDDIYKIVSRLVRMERHMAELIRRLMEKSKVMFHRLTTSITKRRR